MPRLRTVSDATLLDAALDIVHREGPAALSFSAVAAASGLAGSTIVQRFGSKDGLLRAALTRAWDHLDAATASVIADASLDAAGVVDIFVALTGPYDPDDFADQLLVLREDFRDPILRQRGERWIATLAGAVHDRLANTSPTAARLGSLLVAQWQGTLTVWGFTRAAPLPEMVRTAIEQLLARELDSQRPWRPSRG